MIAETKKATFAEAAKTNIEQSKSYRQTFRESRKILKMRIGEMMLCLAVGNAQPDDLKLFDRLLRQLYAGGEV